MSQHHDPFTAQATTPGTGRPGGGYEGSGTYDDGGAERYDDVYYDDARYDDERYRPGRLQRFVTWLLWILSLPVLALFAARLVPDDSITPVAQVVPFFPYGVVAAVPLAVLAVMGRRYVLSLLLLVTVSVGGYLTAPAFFPSAQQATGADRAAPGTLRVMSVNTEYGRADAERVVDLVAGEAVEVLAVQELTPEFEEALTAAGLDELLPYKVTGKVAPGSAAGGGIYSATELTERNPGENSTFAMPSAVVDADGTDVRIRCVHPVPPVPGSTDVWQRELRELGLTARTDDTAQILLGDFNATWDHATFRALLGDRFHDAWRDTGAGLERTWPEGRTLPVAGTAIPALVAIDHVVVDETMRVGDTRSQIVPGTDHRAVLSTIVVSRRD
ncbi:endonuclease/exonuclease/phosphatase family protein [Myceligenerans crystallogenes]